MNLKVFDGNFQQFSDTILVWHKCVCRLPFYRWKATNWYVCDGGHTYWNLNDRYWWRENMEAR